MLLDPVQIKKIAPRLEKENNIWFASTRPDGRPHLVPIWFIWFEQKIWICTPNGTQKIANLRRNSHASVALEDGDSPVILEGTAVIHEERPLSEPVGQVFINKYDWNILTDDDEDYILVEFTPVRMISW